MNITGISGHFTLELVPRYVWRRVVTGIFPLFFIPSRISRRAEIDPHRHGNPRVPGSHRYVDAIAFPEKTIFRRLHEFDHVAVVETQRDSLAFFPSDAFFHRLSDNRSSRGPDRAREYSTRIITPAGCPGAARSTDGSTAHRAEIRFIALDPNGCDLNDRALFQRRGDADLRLRNERFARGKRDSRSTKERRIPGRSDRREGVFS